MQTLVTGIGAITSIGNSVSENLQSLLDCHSGIAPMQILQTVHEVPAGEIKLTNSQLAERAGLPTDGVYSRTMLLGLIAAREAMSDACIDPALMRVGLISATSVGGMDLSEKHFAQIREGKGRARYMLEHDCGASTEHIANRLGIRQFTTTVSTACSSSANAIMLADRLLRHHLLDAVVVGGVDPLCRFTINGFSSLMILDKERCRPFDASRAGLNLGEGAGYLVLQRDDTPAAHTYCQLKGYANANDAHHQTATSEQGTGPCLAMSRALMKAEMKPDDIDYINVHGTGTFNNDQSEGNALCHVFGDKVPRFSSTKVYTGHTLGACGGIEAVFCVLSLINDVIFPTFNFSHQMENSPLIPETKVVKGAHLHNVMSNAFGFGGNVSSIILGL